MALPTAGATLALAAATPRRPLLPARRPPRAGPAAATAAARQRCGQIVGAVREPPYGGSARRGCQSGTPAEPSLPANRATTSYRPGLPERFARSAPAAPSRSGRATSPPRPGWPGSGGDARHLDLDSGRHGDRAVERSTVLIFLD